MILEEYIIQTDGEYSVLRMGNIARLKNEDTHVVIRTFEEKEGQTKIKGGKKRSTDVLTSAGYRLLEKLRGLRLVIAREEGMPPYIIFNDKTLIDMCAKIPRDKQEMLTVSGVAENKFQKYGQRFLDEIGGFIADNPGAVISTKIEDETEDNGKKQLNVGAAWSEEEEERLSKEYLSGMKIAEIAREHGRTGGAVRARLKKQGLIV